MRCAFARNTHGKKRKDVKKRRKHDTRHNQSGQLQGASRLTTKGRLEEALEQKENMCVVLKNQKVDAQGECTVKEGDTQTRIRYPSCGAQRRKQRWQSSQSLRTCRLFLLSHFPPKKSISRRPQGISSEVVTKDCR